MDAGDKVTTKCPPPCRVSNHSIRDGVRAGGGSRKRSHDMGHHHHKQAAVPAPSNSHPGMPRIIPLTAALCTGTKMDLVPFQKLVNTAFSQQQYLGFFSQQLPKGRCMNLLFSPLAQTTEGNRAPVQTQLFKTSC